MKVKEESISNLKPYANNPRKNDEAVDKVAESIREFGFQQPIVVDKSNEIVAGHTRYKAAQKLGMETVPVVVADELTEEQIKAYRLADNKTAEGAVWDWGKLDEELTAIKDMDMTLFGFEAMSGASFAEEFEDILGGVETLPDSRLVIAGVSAFGTQGDTVAVVKIPRDESDKLIAALKEIDTNLLANAFLEAVYGL